MTCTYYTDDLTLLEHTSAPAECHVHCHYMNTNETLFAYFKQTISTLSVKLLKFIDKFNYLGSSISSSKNDVTRRRC